MKQKFFDPAEGVFPPGVVPLLTGLTVSQQRLALCHYAHPEVARRAFDSAFGLARLAAGGGVLLQPPKFTTKTAHGIALDLRVMLAQKHLMAAFCVASVPSPDVAAAGAGHAVALVVAASSQKIIYHDPYGAEPPPFVTQALAQVFPEYQKLICQVPQQRDNYSCALITVMNLAGRARGVGPDAALDGKLWGIRQKQAPGLLAFEAARLEVTRTAAETAWRRDGAVGVQQDRCAAEGRAVTCVTDHAEEVRRHDAMLAAIKGRDPDFPGLSAAQRLLITLARG